MHVCPEDSIDSPEESIESPENRVLEKQFVLLTTGPFSPAFYSWFLTLI